MVAISFLPTLTPQSTLAELPAWDVRLPVSALGSEFDETLRRNPDVPGVVVFDAKGVCGAISRTRFQQTISRPFGREVVRPREIRHLLEELRMGAPDILDVNLPVQEAVRRALAREASMIYEPVLISSNVEGKVGLVGFTDLLQADSRISSLRNQQMKEILATVQEGFLLVDRDHRIASEYSSSVEIILRRADLARLPLTSLLAELLGPDLAELAHGYLETLFNSNVIEKLVTDINPLKSVQVPERPGFPRQHLGFSFKRSMEGAQIRRILVRVEDRTREVELAAELEEQERQAGHRVDLAMEMMQVDPNSLTDYLTRFLGETAQIRRLRSRPERQSDGTGVNAIFRIIHSLKGEAGMLGLRSFTERLHRAEDVAQMCRDSSGSDAHQMERLDPWIESLVTLGAEAKDLVTRLSAMASRQGGEATASQPPDLMPAIERLVADLSSRLGKPARFIASWSPDALPAAYSAVIRDALIQFARNSMVHGIENEQRRREAEKAVPAILQVALRRHEVEEQLEIVFQDDGRGLDPARIRVRARELFGFADLDDDQALQAIFEPGFSTAEQVTEHAGRGVGLDLVRAGVESLGGIVLVHSRPGVFCAFQIVLPLHPEQN